jgi:hypothetical protein
MSSRIVVFGKDPVLLETRQRILEKAGFGWDRFQSAKTRQNGRSRLRTPSWQPPDSRDKSTLA